MTTPAFIPYSGYREYPVEEMRRRAAAFHLDMQRRRTVRRFSDRPVPRDIIESCLGAAGSAPSGRDSASPDSRRLRNYYVGESVGIATGILIAALHQSDLACLTHTPSPMGFLNEILQRPGWEKPFLLLEANGVASK